MRRPLLGITLALVTLLLVPSAVLADLASTTFDDVSIDRSTQELVFTGTISCTQTETANVTVVVTQEAKSDSRTVSVNCSTTPVAWEVRIPLGTPPFHPGPAVIDIGFGAGGTVSGQSLDIFIPAI